MLARHCCRTYARKHGKQDEQMDRGPEMVSPDEGLADRDTPPCRRFIPGPRPRPQD
jgi:hypothetical protein